MRKREVLMWVIALLTAVAATPAVAKPPAGGGRPGGSGLVVAVETGNMMWANSPGDVIPFEVSVTNKTGDSVTVTIQFQKEGSAPVPLDVVTLAKGEAWPPPPPPGEDPRPYLYTVDTGDFEGLPIGEQANDVLAGTVTARAGELFATADAVMTVYPVLPCPPGTTDSFTFGPNAQYSECSFTPSVLPAYWDLTTTRKTPQRGSGTYSPWATVRDGIPGNWCNHDENGQIPQEPNPDGTVTDRVFFPADGVCLNGGAAGQDIPVRNHNTFYLATWQGNTVVATRDVSGSPSTSGSG